MSPDSVVKITPLGGLGEIGKNITAIETEKDMIIIDCGCSFPTEETPGIEKIYPDVSYVIRKSEKLKGIILTHGHEDHIGSLMYFLNKLDNINIPIFCSDFTWALLEEKNNDKKIKNKHHIVAAGTKRKIGESFSVEFIHVNHSIPGAFALAITTPQGLFIHTGDFKIDMQPNRGNMIDLVRFGQLGQKGVKVLMMDSTNSENSGYSVSESVVSRTLENIFNAHADKRIIVSTFASNIYRLCKIIELSEKQGRKVAIAGRSIENSVLAAMKIGICNFKGKTLISLNEIGNYDDNKLTIISTGAQGELTAALSRMADGLHPKVKIERNDVVVISSHAIPGNGKLVDTVINKLYERGAIVYCDKNADIHASGHANKEEQKMILALTKPEYFIPVHGEPLHLRASRRTGVQMGINNKNIVTMKNGQPIMITDEGICKCPPVESGCIYVDGEFENELNPAVIKDRQILMEEGVVVISAVIDSSSKELISNITVNSRGLIFMNESAGIIQNITREARNMLIDCLEENMSVSDIRTEISKRMTRYISQTIGKSPMVLVMLNYA